MGKNHSGAFSFGRETNAFYINKVVILRIKIAFVCVLLGGARSICVFDDGFGGGSISPLIVTGGKGGDVGLHDFRYIATGRSKRHKHSDSSEQNISASLTTDMRNKNGDQNRNGMLWYIPKAHLGTIKPYPL